jgi:hypothetical protein
MFMFCGPVRGALTDGTVMFAFSGCRARMRNYWMWKWNQIDSVLIEAHTYIYTLHYIQ